MKLYLEGTGYLEGIRRDNGFSAKIRLFIRSNETADEILVYADAKDSVLISVLTDLEAKCLKGHTIVLTFRVLYEQFRAHFSGMTQEDATNLLTLQGELQSIDDWCEKSRTIC